MRSAYRRLLDSPMGQQDLVENAVGICEELDRFLVEKLWPEKKKQERRKQEMEMRRDHRPRDEPAQDDNCGV